MSYTVHYDSSGNAKVTRPEIEKKRKWIRVILIAAIVIGIVGYAASNNWLMDVFLPGYNDTTGEAVHNMLQNIRNGEAVGNAVTAFCKEIIADAQR